MIDIKMVNNQIMKVHEVVFDIEKIEKKISEMKYQGNGLVRDIQVEKARLPSIAEIFYEKIFSREIPSPETLFNEYLDKHFVKESITEYKQVSNNQIYNKEGMMARVYRTYPSLLRDFHFYILCFNSGLFEIVEYSFFTDVKEGIDLFITYKGEKFAISLFVDTKRSQSFKKRKYKRHDYSNLKEICISINPFDKKNRIGDYSLYRDSHVQEMVLAMDKELASVS